MASQIIFLFIGIIKILCLCLLMMMMMTFVYFCYIIWVRSHYYHLPWPPLKSFLMGHAPFLQPKEAHLRHLEWTAKYGPLYVIAIMHRVIVVVNSPELAKAVLMDSKKFKKDKFFYSKSQEAVGLRFLGTGLVTITDHEEWKIRRGAINPAFHKSTLNRMIDMFNETGDFMVNDLEPLANTDSMVTMLEKFHRATLDAIGRAAFSENILSEFDSENFDFCDAIQTVLELLNKSMKNPFFAHLPQNRPFVEKTKICVPHLRNKARRMIETRIKCIEAGDITPGDMLDFLVRDMGPQFSMEELIDEVITMFVAGQETTANLLSFLFLNLGRYPDIKKRIYDEVDSILGSKTFVSQTDVDQMEWLTASIKETLRLHPPILGTMRCSPGSRPTLLDNKHGRSFLLPPQSSVIVNYFGIHYLSNEKGFDFEPERFLSADSKERSEKSLPVPDLYSYMPFSMGQRSCIGRHFAYLEAKVLAAKLFQHFTFRLNPDETFEMFNAGVFRPADKVKIFLYKR